LSEDIRGKLACLFFFDVFHHALNPSGSSNADTLAINTRTWHESDGIPMVDYSYRRNDGRKVSHTESIDTAHFEHFLVTSRPYHIDVMLEIKDKETSALKAVGIARKDMRDSFMLRPNDKKFHTLIKKGRLTSKVIHLFQDVIWQHYREHGHTFPWRETYNPYHILISEVMLQQTQTSRIVSKYSEFISAFPIYSHWIGHV